MKSAYSSAATSYTSGQARGRWVRPQREAVHSSRVPQLDETQTPVVMNITEFHQLGESCDTEDVEGSRGVSGGPA